MAYSVMLQRMGDMLERMKEIQEAQTVAGRDSRDMAVSIERILGRMNVLDGVAQEQKRIVQRVGEAEGRMQVIEGKLRDSLEPGHEKRIAKLEKYQIRFIAAGTSAIVILDAMIHVGKVLL